MRFENSIVLVQNLFVDGFVEHVHLCGSKVSRANLLLEEHVDFSKGSAAGLGDAEVGVDDAAEADSTLYMKYVVSQTLLYVTRINSYPEESGIVAPVPSGGIQHVWRQNVCDYAHDVAARAVSDLARRWK